MKLFRNIKILEVYDDCFIGARGYKLYKYIFATKRQEYIGRIDDWKYVFAANFLLLRRLLRAEITHIYTLSNGDRLAIAKKGIFRCFAGDSVFIKSFAIPRGSRPLNLCITPDDHIYFGEYFSNMEKQSVHIYHSGDRGNTWEIAYTFEKGSINHIHGLFWDPYIQQIWVLTGDRENECLIANTNNGFKTLNIILRGGQEYRTTNLFFYKDFIVYATDSQYIINEIRKIDRVTLSVETMQSIQGSAIKGGQNAKFAYISTTVEPSAVNMDAYSHLWITYDGISWLDVYKAKKDYLPSIFQFGSIEFPSYRIHNINSIWFSGRALKNIGGHTQQIELKNYD